MNFRKFILPGVVVISIAALAVVLQVGLNSDKSLTGNSGVARVNRLAEDFTLPLFDGGEITLSDLKGQPVVINFWASWCPPCREEAPILEKTWRLYKDREVVFIGVDIQDREEDALAYIDEFDITYPNGPDLNGRITIDYGVGGIPVTFFVDRDGFITDRWVGAISEEVLTAFIEEILQ